MSSKSRLRLISIGFFLFVLLSAPVLIKANESEVGDEDLEGLEELLAAEQEEEEEALKGQGDKFSEAEVVKRAQAIVVELNNDNAQRIVGSNEYVFMMGYAPWCARSAELMPHFAHAANSLKEMGSSLVLAKVDAERYSKAATFLGVKGFPTLLLFVNGTSQPYTGGFTGYLSFLRLLCAYGYILGSFLLVTGKQLCVNFDELDSQNFGSLIFLVIKVNLDA